MTAFKMTYKSVVCVCVHAFLNIKVYMHIYMYAKSLLKLGYLFQHLSEFFVKF